MAKSLAPKDSKKDRNEVEHVSEILQDLKIGNKVAESLAQVENIEAQGPETKSSSKSEQEEDDCTEKDNKTFRLLELLSEYESLANDSMRVNFVQAYLDLSRANYHGMHRFNMDSVDMRPRDASTVVEWVEGEFRLNDKWQVYSEKVRKLKKEKEKEKEKEKLGKQEETKSHDNQKEGAVSSALKKDTELRNRKNGEKNDEKKSAKSAKTKEDEPNPPQNPVYQFGRMVPIQLRNAQTHFQKALADSVRLLCLQQEIVSLVSSLRS